MTVEKRVDKSQGNAPGKRQPLAGKDSAFWKKVQVEGGPGEKKQAPDIPVKLVRLSTAKNGHPARKTDLDRIIRQLNSIGEAELAGNIFTNLAKDFDKFHPDDVKEIVRAAITRKRNGTSNVPLKEAVGFMTILDEQERAELFTAVISHINGTFAAGAIKVFQSFSPELQKKHRNSLICALTLVPHSKDELIELIDSMDVLPEVDRMKVINQVFLISNLDPEVADYAFEKIRLLPDEARFVFCQSIYRSERFLELVKDVIPETEWKKFLLILLKGTENRGVFLRAIDYSLEFPLRERKEFFDAALKNQERFMKSGLIGLFKNLLEKDGGKRRSDKLADAILSSFYWEGAESGRTILENIRFFSEKKKVELLKKVFSSSDMRDNVQIAFGMIAEVSDRYKPGLYLAAADSLPIMVLDKIDIFKHGKIVCVACKESKDACEKTLDILERAEPEKRLAFLYKNPDFMNKNFSIRLVTLIADCPSSEKREKILVNIVSHKYYQHSYSNLSALLESFPEEFRAGILEDALKCDISSVKQDAIKLFASFSTEKRTGKLADAAKSLISEVTVSSSQYTNSPDLFSTAFHSIFVFSQEEQEVLLGNILKSNEQNYLDVIYTAIEAYAKLPHAIQKQETMELASAKLLFLLTGHNYGIGMKAIELIPLFLEDLQAELISNTIAHSCYSNICISVIKLIPALPLEYQSQLWVNAKQKILEKVINANGYDYDGLPYLKCAEVLPIADRKEVILAAINQKRNLDAMLASDEIIGTLPVEEQESLRKTLRNELGNRFDKSYGLTPTGFEQTYSRFSDPELRSKLIHTAIFSESSDLVRIAAVHLGEVKQELQADILIKLFGYSRTKEAVDAALLLLPNQPKESRAKIVKVALGSKFEHISRAALAHVGELEPLESLALIAENPSLLPELLERFVLSSAGIRDGFIRMLRERKGETKP